MKGRAAIFLALLAGAARGEEGGVQSTVEFLSSLGSRVSGYPGAEEAASFVEQQLRRAGVQEVKREEFSLAVPVDHGGQLRVEDSGEVFPVHGLWPNQVAPSTLPPGGLSLDLTWGGFGEWEELEGKELTGRAVLMEFNSWNHWLRAASLGARIIVFVEPEQTTRVQAASKVGWVPLEVPRFWIGWQAGQILKGRLAQGEVQVHLEARTSWEQRPAWNIWGIAPGQDLDPPDSACRPVGPKAHMARLSFL